MWIKLDYFAKVLNFTKNYKFIYQLYTKVFHVVFEPTTFDTTNQITVALAND